MDKLWMGIDPQERETRILLMAGPEKVLLKARLDPFPSSRAALSALMEALALWQGQRLRAALVVDGPDGSVRARFASECFGTLTSPLYGLEYVPALRPPTRRDGLRGMGRFEDLRQLLLFEAMR